MSAKYRIFIIEDDKALANAMEKSISSWGYEVKSADDLVTSELESFSPHLVILDIMLPRRNGYMLCEEIRKSSNVPIVFLSSAAENMNIIMAMQSGGDDFIAKPVDSNVLITKIQAILRRAYDMSLSPALEYGGVSLFINDGTVAYGGKRAELTKNEFRILQTLMEHKGKIVSRETLMERLWQMDHYVEENTLTVNVARLRKKLSDLGVDDFIKTRVGSGYIIGGAET